MNIALVSQEYPPQTARGGIGSQTFAKAHGLSKMGHNVYVISRSLDSKRHEDKQNNLTVIRIPGFEERLEEMTEIVQWITHSVAVAAELQSLGKRIKLDIIDFPEWAAEGYVYLLNRTAWDHVPVVIHLHGPLVMFAHTMNWPDIASEFYRYGTQMEAACIKLADAVFSSSLCSGEWIKKYYDSSKDKIPTIHTGVDAEFFTLNKAEKNDYPTIIFVGKFVQNKGVHELVEVASRLVIDYPNLRLRLIGKGSEEIINQLKNTALQFGAGSLLAFPGYIDKVDLPQELCRAHIFAAPSYYEGGPGFVYLEAMACGLPVVGCSGSGVDEIIESEKNGYLVPPKNIDKLEEALRKLLSEPRYVKEMGDNARQYVLKEADTRTCLKRLEEFYNSVLTKNNVKSQ